MSKKHGKDKDVVRYEEDLYYYVKIRKKNRESFIKFPELYDSFISKNHFDTEELKTGKIKFKYTEQFESYILNNYKELSMILDILNSFDSLDLNYLKKIIINYLITFNKPWKMISKIKSKSDLMNILIGVMNEKDIIVKAVFELAIKTYILFKAQNLKNKMKFIDKAYDDFNQYFNLFVNKELIPDELIDRISKLMIDEEFIIPSNVIDEKDPVLALLKYTADFANYTEFHNLTVKKNKELQAIKDFEKATNNHKEIPGSNNSEIDSEIKTITSQEDIVFESDEALLNKEEVGNMVKSFLPGICADDKCSIEDNMLPSKYDPNYNDIIIGLLKAYEEYISNSDRCTMRDFNKYNDLSIRVEQIKEKS